MSDNEYKIMFPHYAYYPGGPWPHPVSSPEGHSHGQRIVSAPPILDDEWDQSPQFVRGVALFNAGYYWEAHEAWESLWHTHGRKGTEADLLKALIKLAAAGVKAREGRPQGVSTHARRAGRILRTLGEQSKTGMIFGLVLENLARFAESLADNPDIEAGPREAEVFRVFDFSIAPMRDG